MFASYIAIGDSFTEGVGDDLPDGRVRGWADFVALGLALASDDEVTYANLAIRGRKLAPLLAEQLEPAIAQHPQLISLNGGGNDIMRPRVSTASVVRQLEVATERVTGAGIHMLLLSGANPSDHLPMGNLVSRRGDELDAAAHKLFPRENATFVDNWSDPILVTSNTGHPTDFTSTLSDTRASPAMCSQSSGCRFRRSGASTRSPPPDPAPGRVGRWSTTDASCSPGSVDA